jgi:YidC/Oxa1 family membrane protein insertase
MDFLTNPFIIALLFLYRVFGESLVLAIIAFTVITRLAIFPLTMQQIKSSKKMQELSPKLQQIREKYKGDREKQAQAQMALYREHGVNPLAGCLPLLIQMPILFGLYGAIYAALGSTPLQLLDVSSRLLVPELSSMIPLKNTFLWMNLGMPDQTLILPALVVATTWLQSKLMTPPVSDPKDPSAATARTMTTIMPIMIGLFSLSFASGLSLYWIASNIAGIAQYALTGQADFRRIFGRAPAPAAATAGGGKTVSVRADSKSDKPARLEKEKVEKGDKADTPSRAPTKKTKGLPPPQVVVKRADGSKTPVASTSPSTQKPGGANGSSGINRKKRPDAPKTANAPRKK